MSVHLPNEGMLKSYVASLLPFFICIWLFSVYPRIPRCSPIPKLLSGAVARGCFERLVLPRGRGCTDLSAATASSSSVGEGRRRGQLILRLTRRRLQQLGGRHRRGRLHLVGRDRSVLVC